MCGPLPPSQPHCRYNTGSTWRPGREQMCEPLPPSRPHCRYNTGSTWRPGQGGRCVGLSLHPSLTAGTIQDLPGGQDRRQMCGPLPPSQPHCRYNTGSTWRPGREQMCGPLPPSQPHCRYNTRSTWRPGQEADVWVSPSIPASLQVQYRIYLETRTRGRCVGLSLHPSLTAGTIQDLAGDQYSTVSIWDHNRGAEQCPTNP